MSNDKLLEYLIDDMKEVKKDVKDILRFRWQIVGGSVVASLILGLAVQLILARI